MRIKNLMADRLQSYQLQGGIELLLVVGFILIFISFQMKTLPTYRTKTHLSEAFMLLSTVKQDYAQYFMERGYWPTAQYLKVPDNELDNQAINSIYFDGRGAFHVEISEKVVGSAGKMLSFVAALNPEIPMSNILWLCGFDKPIEGFVLQSENHTNIPENLLSVACRSVTHL